LPGTICWPAFACIFTQPIQANRATNKQAIFGKIQAERGFATQGCVALPAQPKPFEQPYPPLETIPLQAAFFA
jgi:hypothetical protein